MRERRVAVVVEDDEDIRGLLAAVLGQSGFDVHEAANGSDGVAAVREHAPAVVTVDLGLPDIDGFEVTRQLRQFSDAYVVMLTARAEEIDTLQGLDVGADDYVTKPFRPRELRARIEAMLRRPRAHGALPPPADPAPTWPPAAGVPAAVAPVPRGWGSATTPLTPGTPPEPAAATASATLPHRAGPVSATSASWPCPPTVASAPAPARSHAPGESTCLQLDGLALFPCLHQVEVDGLEVPLTPTEFSLLETLLHSGRVVRSKAELARTVRGGDADDGTFVSRSDERTVEVHVGNLRRKLADDPKEPRWIETVRGIGYRTAGTVAKVR